jgi:hypothetical protein
MITVAWLGRRTTMARVSVSLFGVVVTVVALGVPAQGAMSAPVPPRDSVVGGGEAGRFLEIAINASSDPLGGDPSGSVAFSADIELGGRLIRVRVGGPVTCLAVERNRAVIGFLTVIGPAKAVAVDNGSTGSPADEFGVGNYLPRDCSDQTGITLIPLSFGDIVVRDAPSKDQCRGGGWRSYTDGAGQPFKSQGECIAFALGAA